ARSLRLLDREEEWVGDLRHAIELQPRLPVSWLDLAIYHARRGAPDSVRTASARFLEYRSESGRAPAGASDALTRALMGTASVAAFLRTVPSDSATDWSWLAVQLYAMRGESDSAFSKLRKLESSRGIDFPTTAPFLAGYLGGDARWRTVRKRLGL
ncbi:MAG TPA: hypothetical protein VFB89_05210, partial [Gemmatimonadales bacterium]|nr:hypothetical protein [Gemmatimonadales bacterium]